MVLWRISNYASLDGIGGLLVAGRWHTKGHAVVYCSPNPSTALLETLVHIEIDPEDLPERFQVLRIEGPDSLSVERVSAGKLAPEWSVDQTSTQSVGDEWLSSGRSLLLEVPSVLVPETWNLLVNPLHGEVNRLRIAEVYVHPYDTRLVRGG